jgi:hypothetical protein
MDDHQGDEARLVMDGADHYLRTLSTSSIHLTVCRLRRPFSQF